MVQKGVAFGAKDTHIQHMSPRTALCVALVAFVVEIRIRIPVTRECEHILPVKLFKI